MEDRPQCLLSSSYKSQDGLRSLFEQLALIKWTSARVYVADGAVNVLLKSLWILDTPLSYEAICLEWPLFFLWVSLCVQHWECDNINHFDKQRLFSLFTTCAQRRLSFGSLVFCFHRYLWKCHSQLRLFSSESSGPSLPPLSLSLSLSFLLPISVSHIHTPIDPCKGFNVMKKYFSNVCPMKNWI